MASELRGKNVLNGKAKPWRKQARVPAPQPLPHGMCLPIAWRRALMDPAGGRVAFRGQSVKLADGRPFDSFAKRLADASVTRYAARYLKSHS